MSFWAGAASSSGAAGMDLHTGEAEHTGQEPSFPQQELWPALAEKIAGMPYFETLRLASDAKFLDSLGRWDQSRAQEVDLSQRLVDLAQAEKVQTSLCLYAQNKYNLSMEVAAKQLEMEVHSKDPRADPKAAASARAVWVRQQESKSKELKKLMARADRLYTEAFKQRHELAHADELARIKIMDMESLQVEVHLRNLKVQGLRKERAAANAGRERAGQEQHVSNEVLAALVKRAFKGESVRMHPDKRLDVPRDQAVLEFQALKEAMTCLVDPHTRAEYMNVGHAEYQRLTERRAAEEGDDTSREKKLARDLRNRTGRAGGRKHEEDRTRAGPARAEAGETLTMTGGETLTLMGGEPNKCTCPSVALLDSVFRKITEERAATINVDAARVLLEWSCRHAEEDGVQGYLVQMRHRDKQGMGDFVTVRGAEGDARMSQRLVVTPDLGLSKPGAYTFRVRAFNAQGQGEWSMASEWVRVGCEPLSPQEEAERLAESLERQRQRLEEAMDDARDALARWSSPWAKGGEVLGKLVAAVYRAERLGLANPVVGTPEDLAALERARERVEELRASAVSRAEVQKWKPRLRELTGLVAGSAGEEKELWAAGELLSVVESVSSSELPPSVLDMLHQLVRRAAERVNREHEGACERVADMLRAAQTREDLWREDKIALLRQSERALDRDRRAVLMARLARAEQQREKEEARLRRGTVRQREELVGERGHAGASTLPYSPSPSPSLSASMLAPVRASVQERLAAQPAIVTRTSGVAPTVQPTPARRGDAITSEEWMKRLFSSPDQSCACRNGCGFFGQIEKEGFCSMCFIQERPGEVEFAPVAPPHPPAAPRGMGGAGPAPAPAAAAAAAAAPPNRGGGKSAQLIQQRSKTKMCFRWTEKGKCHLGARCTFAHGEHELRPREQGRAAASPGGASSSQLPRPPSPAAAQSPLPPPPFTTAYGNAPQPARDPPPRYTPGSRFDGIKAGLAGATLGYGGDLECSVCLNDYCSGGGGAHDPVTLECGHTFCASCVMMIRRKEQPSCPQDRSPIRPDFVPAVNRAIKSIAEAENTNTNVDMLSELLTGGLGM